MSLPSGSDHAASSGKDDGWPDPVTVDVRDRVGVSIARRLARRMARALGFGQIPIEEIVLSASELGNNLWQHAGKGRLSLEPLDQPQVGIRLTSEDEGPGIPNLLLALQDGVSTRGGMGSGLAAVGRLMDAVRIESSPGRGTRIEAIKWRS